MTQVQAESLEARLTDQYGLATATLGDLGFDPRTIRNHVPSVPELLDGITKEQTVVLEARHEAGIPDTLNIAPLVRDIGLEGGKRPGLLPRFDRMQIGELRPTTRNVFGMEVLKNYFDWEGIDDTDPVHDNQDSDDWPVSIVLEDDIDSPFLVNTSRRPLSEPGVVYQSGGCYFDRNLRFTQNDLDREIELAAKAGFTIHSANIAQVVMRIAQIRRQERIAGRDSLIDRNEDRNYGELRGGGNVAFLHYPWRHHRGRSDPVVPVLRNSLNDLELSVSTSVYTAIDSVNGVVRITPIAA